jgi:membrane-bound lytic murein transglycosylase D
MRRTFFYLLLFIFVTSGCSAKLVVLDKEENRSSIASPEEINGGLIEGHPTLPKAEDKKGGGFKLQENEKGEVKIPSSFSSELLTSDEEEDTGIRSILEEDLSRKFDIPVVFNDAVRYFINYFTTEKRKVFANWLRRAEKYVPIMREILKEEGLPEDLVYLAMIESGFNPKAYSPAKASGPWQFVYSTGERYGLKVDYWVDERRDPEKSTVAAARYLKDLFNQFGCWYLAAASYNVGERKVEKVVERHGSRDIWELIKYNTLPKETREYIPKLIAAAIIAKNPEQFGFEKISYENPLTFLKLKVPKATPLKKIAEAAEIDLDTVRSYNPEILRGITPPDREFVIKLPASTDKDAFYEKLSEILSTQRKVKSYFPYRVKKTDTIGKISARYGISKEILCLWNSDSEAIRIKPGRVIFIPRFCADKEKKGDNSNKEEAKFATYTQKVKTKSKVEKRVLYHRVKRGDTLFGISERYGVDVSSIKRLNNLKGERIYPGMTLRIPLKRT